MSFWGIAIIFRRNLVSRAAVSRKNEGVIFRDYIFNAVPEKFQIFNVSTTENFNCEWNMATIY